MMKDLLPLALGNLVIASDLISNRFFGKLVVGELL